MPATMVVTSGDSWSMTETGKPEENGISFYCAGRVFPEQGRAWKVAENLHIPSRNAWCGGAPENRMLPSVRCGEIFRQCEMVKVRKAGSGRSGSVVDGELSVGMEVIMRSVLDETAKAASELVERHGLESARDIINQRIARFERQACWPEHDLALLLLTAIEKLAQKTPD
jgi:hypothetical protein